MKSPPKDSHRKQGAKHQTTYNLMQQYFSLKLLNWRKPNKRKRNGSKEVTSMQEKITYIHNK